MKPWLPALGVAALAPLAWQAAIWIFAPPPALLPSPALVARVLWSERRELAGHTLVTLGEAVGGYALANVLALGLAFLFYRLRTAEAVLAPWLVVAKNIPFPALASILVVLLGDTLAPKLVVVVLVTFFPILANVSQGLRSADPVLVDRLRTLHASPGQIFRKVAWPAALPAYFAAHEIAFTGSIIAAIAAEWLFAQRGLGYLIVHATTQFRTDRLFAVTLIASALAIAAYGLVRLAAAHFLRWRRL